MRAHLAIFYADRGDLQLQILFPRSKNRLIGSLHSSGDLQQWAYKIAETGTQAECRRI